MHEPRGLIFDRPPFFGVGCTGAARWHRETAGHRCYILSFWSIWTLVPHWLVELSICENLQTLLLSLYLTSMQINPPGLWAIHNALVVNLDANMRYNLSPVIPSWTRKPSIINIGNLADQRGPGRRFSDRTTASHVVTGPLIRPTFSIQRLKSSDSKILLNLSFLLRLKYKLFFVQIF
jgi:hypothetical protein